MSSRSAEAIRGTSNRPAWSAEGISGGVETLRLWYARRRQRRELFSLDDRMLRDIGLSRADIEHEYRKPFWRG